MRLILLMKDVRMRSLKRKRGTFMENKVRFKLHKVKKQWVTIAISGLALG
ncbi:MAG: KxYKxGKxW signal peptide domain-containing protein, partial [Streptococcus salivarius]|nr:KxYKxGKxW signal peptide domain-containing protein [Streptococcus salivarius]